MRKAKFNGHIAFAQFHSASPLAKLEAELWLFYSPVLQELNHSLLSYTNKDLKWLNVSTEAKLIASKSDLAWNANTSMRKQSMF